jgi:hypothetical protein
VTIIPGRKHVLKANISNESRKVLLEVYGCRKYQSQDRPSVNWLVRNIGLSGTLLGRDNLPGQSHCRKKVELRVAPVLSSVPHGVCRYKYTTYFWNSMRGRVDTLIAHRPSLESSASVHDGRPEAGLDALHNTR